MVQKQEDPLSCDFHMLNQLTYQDGLNSAVVVDLECVCHFAAQTLAFVGGRIGAQKRTADYIHVLRLPEFNILCHEEALSSPA